MQGIRSHIARVLLALTLLFQGNFQHTHFHFNWFELSHHEVHESIHTHSHDCESQAHLSEDCSACDFAKTSLIHFSPESTIPSEALGYSYPTCPKNSTKKQSPLPTKNKAPPLA